MKDTTTTIDEILGTLDSRYGDWAKCDTTYMKEYLDEAKQALLRWHKDKARSYVLELIGEDEDLIVLAPLPGHQKDAWARNIFRHTLRAKLDQTLKAIGGQDNVGSL